MNLPVLKCVAATIIASTVGSAAWLASQLPGMDAAAGLHLADAAQAERRLALPPGPAASEPSAGPSAR